MKCSRELITGLVDEELGFDRQAELEEHLAGCRNCSEEYSQILERQAAVRSCAPYYTAPDHLEQSVRDVLKRVPLEKPQAETRNDAWRLLAVAASIALAFSLAWNFTQFRARTSESELMADNILSSHVRSLIGTHLLDVASTEQHTVKPWFDGRIDFSPVVKDFGPQGFPLIGARIEYLSGRAGAALVYQRRSHFINLFTWPARSSDTQQSRVSRNGYNELQWIDTAMTYWAVSDLELAELQRFKELCINQDK